MKITSGRVLALRIPTDQQPHESDGTAIWDSTTIVIVQLRADGITGTGYAYANEAAAHVSEQLLREVVIGKDAFAIPAVHDAMDIQVRNWGRPGLVSSAISAIDNCLWDLKGRLLDEPVICLLGAARDEVTAYGSGGFTSYSEAQLVEQMTCWAGEGLRFVKMKVGREPDKDIARARAVVDALKGRAELFVDANGAYKRKQALQKAKEYAELGVTWFEEPVSSDDRIGLHLLVDRAPDLIRIAAGEYSYTLDDVKDLIETQSVDVMQADATRCGGITNFMKIAGVCDMFHFPLSAHTSPTLHATLCCAASAAFNVEYFHDHVRIEGMIFDGAIRQNNGALSPDESRPGLGIDVKEKDAEHFKTYDAEVSNP